MYSNHFPDGLTRDIIDALIAEAFDTIDEAAAEPTSALLDGPAARRWTRRVERRTITGTVRTLPVSRPLHIGPDGEEAA
ncbi:hypothetical protein [Kibdelosporangium aridum]|uniref:Uncharacterized protein n=1 Tax=Kibdelosporangium aridum TaxID=2030 RepID=A0A1Y5XRL3_KIBAR|nr:hypothetical protein [Kibdelosporangium aridum]SMD14132.1 hypothetical protein SAMN05661093_04976 [Kibdelosporangium aridum]